MDLTGCRVGVRSHENTAGGRGHRLNSLTVLDAVKVDALREGGIRSFDA